MIWRYFEGQNSGLYKFGEVMVERKLEVQGGMRTGTAEARDS